MPLKVKEGGCSETLLRTYQTTRCPNTEDNSIHLHCLKTFHREISYEIVDRIQLSQDRGFCEHGTYYKGPTYSQCYVVWQKSNEIDFLLTMNFILFTNQGYPLQNSSLGQLHSNGGVVTIVRSSARRLMLVYLSARRLRSSGYYPKYQNGALSSGF